MQAKRFFIGLSVTFGALVALAQTDMTTQEILGIEETEIETPVAVVSVSDSLAAVMDSIGFVAEPAEPLPLVIFLPQVYVGHDRTLYDQIGQLAPTAADSVSPWLGKMMRTRRFANALMQYHAIHNMDQVPYNINTMAAPPKKYVAFVDPMRTVTVFEEIGAMPGAVNGEKQGELVATEVVKQHWRNKLGINIQFQQAYVSSNWYQGGNSSLNLLTDFTYDTKLNTKFHPNLMFENFFQWRTALASTPDDPYRSYGITENRFQINSKFGVKAFKKWYYSVTGMLKTPVFNGYRNGTDTRTASFLSPGELNLGVGMSYSTQSSKFKFSLSIAPLSYNLKTVIDSKVSETSHGIEAGKKSKSSYGSNLEMNWEWKICYNVTWTSRVFAFTNYDYYQADWHNQFAFTINRFLSANLTVDMRYDSSAKPVDKWKRFQLRELISLGFTYAISH